MTRLAPILLPLAALALALPAVIQAGGLAAIFARLLIGCAS